MPFKLNYKIPLIKKTITIALPNQYLLEYNILGFYSGDALELSPVLQNDHPWCGTGSGRSGCVARPRRRLLLRLARYVFAPQPLFLQRRATRRRRASSNIALSLAPSVSCFARTAFHVPTDAQFVLTCR